MTIGGRTTPWPIDDPDTLIPHPYGVNDAPGALALVSPDLAGLHGPARSVQ
jgi:hypothetical protein